MRFVVGGEKCDVDGSRRRFEVRFWKFCDLPQTSVIIRAARSQLPLEPKISNLSTTAINQPL